MKRKCEFSIPFSGNPSALYQRAVIIGKKYNSKISGDAQHGTVEVVIFGARLNAVYTVDSNIIRIEIFEKPMFIPCKKIEGLIRQFLN
jgi:hypothetical protein